MPEGLYYTPATGYIGNDTFKITVTDCANASDTTELCLHVGDCALGNNTPGQSHPGILSVHPNPGNGLFAVVLISDRNEETKITLTNIIGQTIKEITTATNKQTDIYLNAPPGMYFLTAKTEEGRFTAKVLIR